MNRLIIQNHYFRSTFPPWQHSSKSTNLHHEYGKDNSKPVGKLCNGSPSLGAIGHYCYENRTQEARYDVDGHHHAAKKLRRRNGEQASH